eukprot:TRINITY_DN179_c0_g1_i4.p1 TRINITY_DN179_c0_g1~~TRINITY_DN179_c0_g1_i4.p1  ORF type:complete len:1062 (-),score=234.95 TRINITY_DN179_c0_g1_i4:108-3206(-)
MSAGPQRKKTKKGGNNAASTVANPPPVRQPPPDPRMQTGIVKSVNSGDTVTIIEVDDINRKQVKEFLFTLIGLKVPQLAKRTPEGWTSEEPFAWQSREFLRKLVVGKPVVYCDEHGIGNRKYGELWTHDQQDVRHSIVSAGWADVIVKPPRKDRSGQELEPSYAQVELDRALQRAKDERKGIWSKNTKDAIRNIKVHDVYRDVNTQELYSDELFEFYKGIKDKRHLKGVVETVKNGTSYTIYLPDTMDQFPLLLSGVRLPSKKGSDESGVEQLTRESKFIAEYFLLHRDVTITIDGVDKLNIFGTVTCGDINIARTLLELGLVVFVDWSAPKDPSTSDSYRKAEKHAQEKRRKIWVDHAPVPKQVQSGGSHDKAAKETNITGTVVEVVNSMTITVRVSKADSNNAQKTVDRIITLSSIRAPRVVKQDEEVKYSHPTARLTGDDKNKAEQDAKTKKEEDDEEIKRELAIAQEAKEFLRNALIGKKVKCIFDYPRSFGNNKNQPPQVRLYWSVYLVEGSTEKNIAVELVRQGLARVVSHPEDELRATDYQDLVVSEKNAESAHKGIHSAVYRQQNVINLTPLPRGADASSGGGETKSSNLIAKCKQFFTFFQNKPRIDAIVDYVFAASRFKLSIPSQGCVIMFTLQGCIVDKPIKATEDIAAKPDISPFDKQFPPTSHGNKALHFTRDHVYQRKVQISVASLDNFGNFLGHMYINNKEFALTLIEQGHAKLHYKIAKKFQNFEIYKTAEEKARKQLKGLWETFDFEAEKQAMLAPVERQVVSEASASKGKSKDPFPIIVTDIRSGNTFSYQIQNEETSALNELSISLQNENFARHPHHAPKKGEIIAAQYTMDDLWYRAEVLSLVSQGKDLAFDYEVKYIDYGNREVLPHSRIRQLDQEFVDLMKPQAYDGKLVGVKTPEEDDAKDAIEGFKELVSGRTLYALEISTENTAPKGTKGTQLTHNVVLTDKDKDLGLELIANGYTRVDKRLKQDDPLYALYHEAEEYARRERFGIWQYGYNPDSDEERELERQLLR